MHFLKSFWMFVKCSNDAMTVKIFSEYFNSSINYTFNKSLYIKKLSLVLVCV